MTERRRSRNRLQAKAASLSTDACAPPRQHRELTGYSAIVAHRATRVQYHALLNVSLPISLQDLDRGFTTVPNILYDSLHPPVDRGYSAVKIHNNLSFTDAGLLHTHQLPRDIREGMLASFIKNNPSSAEIIKSLVTI